MSLFLSLSSLNAKTNHYEESTKKTFPITCSNLHIFNSVNAEIIFKVSVSRFDGSDAKTVDDVDFLILSIKHISTNKVEKIAEANNKIKDDLKKQSEKIIKLETERDTIAENCEHTETNNLEVNNMYKRIGELSLSIRSAKKEYAKIKDQGQNIKYESYTDKYSVKISRDTATYIEGFPNQPFSFRLSWNVANDNKARIEKKNIKIEEHSLTVVN